MYKYIEVLRTVRWSLISLAVLSWTIYIVYLCTGPWTAQASESEPLPTVVSVFVPPPVEETSYVKPVELPRPAPRYLGMFRITAYCTCRVCTGKWSQYKKTASGKVADWRRGIVAVDKRVISLGTRLDIEGLGRYKAEDTGGAIRGCRIDILMRDHKTARLFGVKLMKVYLDITRDKISQGVGSGE